MSPLLLALLVDVGELTGRVGPLLAQARPASTQAIITAIENVRTLLLGRGVAYAGLRGTIAAYQIMSATEQMDQIRARKSLEYVGWGLVILFIAAGVLTLIAQGFQQAGLAPIP